MDKFDWFKTQFEELSSDKQVDVYNKYCDINKLDSHIYPMSDINEVFAGCTPFEILSNVSLAYFDVKDDYFAATSNGLESFNDVELFLDDYLSDIYKCNEAWEKDIDEGGYLDEIYEEYLDFKPKDMDLDFYYEIVEKAVKQYELESNIEDYLNEYMKFK